MNKLIANGSALLTCPEMHDHGMLPFDVLYDPVEPLVIAAAVTDDAGETYSWKLDRKLILFAVEEGDRDDCAVVGGADFTLKVRRTDRGSITLRLPVVRGGRPKKFTYLILHRDQLRRFVTRTYELVPAHRESELLGLDRIDQLAEEWK